MKAVLWDMDGTLVDSEKLWDISLQALYARLGGVLTPEVRETTVGSSSEGLMTIVYTDLGWSRTPLRWRSPRTGCTTTPASCSSRV